MSSRQNRFEIAKSPANVIVLRTVPLGGTTVLMYVENEKLFSCTKDGVPIEQVLALIDESKPNSSMANIASLLDGLGYPPFSLLLSDVEDAIRRLAEDTKGLIIHCHKCGKTFTKQSPILLTAPDEHGYCKKLHYCSWECVHADTGEKDAHGYLVRS